MWVQDDEELGQLKHELDDILGQISANDRQKNEKSVKIIADIRNLWETIERLDAEVSRQWMLTDITKNTSRLAIIDALEGFKARLREHIATLRQGLEDSK